ncbi:extracellular solute-binding protein [Clostridium bowmanii]|uniref:ABC transporter substrate-binding protein n=1 Tax=Clostridium bowmanii TaxID=132925 RepID=UPI001C0B8BD1|nr:extracellular solute-binding protein [Clostridium bowmanii]MBU3190165.1 extracellular solute-binding protein [Clostridium bowmanii]MCA1074859.1 extracellular solute-binding protein [Clostridium bowmanii]
MEIKIMKRFSLILLSTFMATLVGCTPKVTVTPTNTDASQNKVVLRVYAQYSMDDEKQPFDYAKEQMKTIMPNVELDLEIMAQDDNQKIKTYAATKNLPDIFVATTDIIESFKKSDNILKLDNYVKELGIEEQFLPSSVPLLKDSNGNTWAIPDAGQFAALLYYNKDVFTKNGVKVPTNYAEFLSAVKKFKANKVVPLALFAKEKWPGVQLFDMLASREEAKGITKLDLGEGKASDPAFKNAATKLLELVNAGLLPKGAFNLNSDDAGAQFKQGKAAMYLSGAWSMSDLGTAMGDNVGILYYPLADESNASSVKWNMSGGGYNSGLAV